MTKADTRMAVETAIDLSRMSGTWEGLVRRYGRGIRRWPEPNQYMTGGKHGS